MTHFTSKTNLFIGQIVRHVLSPDEDPIRGMVVYIKSSITTSGERLYFGVQWVDHSGQPGKVEEHIELELVPTR